MPMLGRLDIRRRRGAGSQAKQALIDAEGGRETGCARGRDVPESTPVYPTPSRYCQTVEKHGLTQFYSAPTAIHLLRRLCAHHVEGHDLSTLRNWYNEEVGNRQHAIVDTFHTETNSIVVTPFPGAIEIKPGSATVPVFGIDPVILDPISGKELEGNDVEGVLALSAPWPSITRTNYRDYKRYVETYVKPYPGLFYTGDGAACDEHGYIWSKDRIDDVINVSGHRLSTAEIESALVMHKGVAETAVIAFFTLKPEFAYDPTNETAFTKEPFLQVRKVIGPFAAPKKIYIVSDLPKTRSGKIIRRIMRKTVAGEGDRLGDLSMVAEPGVVDISKKKVAESA
ncbi:hypothetical protein EV421DRAFT_1926243 [Armillaria borealis]|uniref:acetate--CoA ligase n=1 Tax=Armillaria borealis TaxID=47425 RepID=A0AA39JTH8_9AGAR|nr:hypothetical protein EV421DRAFT_1926243 [Armillaria borealis]